MTGRTARTRQTVTISECRYRWLRLPATISTCDWPACSAGLLLLSEIVGTPARSSRTRSSVRRPPVSELSPARGIGYANAWLKCWHPDIFCAALLNAQPTGFYAPAQFVRDAIKHRVDVRPVCANASRGTAPPETIYNGWLSDWAIIYLASGLGKQHNQNDKA